MTIEITASGHFFLTRKKWAKKRVRPSLFLQMVRFGTLLRTQNSQMFFSVVGGWHNGKEPKEKVRGINLLPEYGFRLL